MKYIYKPAPTVNIPNIFLKVSLSIGILYSEDTEANIYGESEKKYFKTGFRVNCLISWDPSYNLDDFGPDKNVTVELYFHRTSLSESEFYPEIGDIVEWNDFFFEINSVTEPQLIGGHQGFKHEIQALAHRVRLSSLQIIERPR